MRGAARRGILKNAASLTAACVPARPAIAKGRVDWWIHLRLGKPAVTVGTGTLLLARNEYPCRFLTGCTGAVPEQR